MRGLPIMTHPDLARWADYLRGLSAAGERRALRRHLDSGCQRCAARVAALAPVGVRNSEPPAGRHLLFETTEWTLDVSVESEADPAGSRAVAGICLGHESSPLVGAAVLAIMGERVVDRTRTGEIGEFQLTGLPSERLELWLVAGAGRPLVAEIDLATAGRPGGRERLALTPEDTRALYMAANAMVAVGEVERALEWAGRARRLEPADPMVLYNLACIYSLAGKVDEALDCLEVCFGHGFTFRGWAQRDSNLDAIRGHPRYGALMAESRTVAEPAG